MDHTLTTLKALADASRLRILMLLETPLCLCQVTEILGLAGSTVSKHLQILQDAGLIRTWAEGKWHYFAEVEQGPPAVLDILSWVRRESTESEVARSDIARRAVILRNAPVPCPQESKARVLFLCTGNSCRSQMAEAILRKYAGTHFEVYSAGLDPQPIHPMTFDVMEEAGFDLSGHQSKGVLEYLGRTHFGYLVTVCRETESRCPIFPGVSYRLHWPFEDPAAILGTDSQRLAAFRRTRDEIEKAILSWLGELSRQGRISLQAVQEFSIKSNVEET